MWETNKVNNEGERYHSAGGWYTYRWANGKVRRRGTHSADGWLHGIELKYNSKGHLTEKNIYVRGLLRHDLWGEQHRLTRLMLFGQGKRVRQHMESKRPVSCDPWSKPVSWI